MSYLNYQLQYRLSNIWIISIVNGEKVKKNKKSFTKTRKFSNLKTPIPSHYCPMCFFLNVNQILFIRYELFKFQKMKIFKFKHTNLLWVLPNVFL